MPTKDSTLVNAFLSEFVKQLAAKHAKDIDFILLFGSAARGEFRAGISDVDMIIQLKSDATIAKVEKYAEQIFWKLDKRHGTQLYKVCSTSRGDLFAGLEQKVKLYKPFEVLGPNDIKWKEGKITSPGLGIFAAIAPIYQFAKKVKREGRILYGRNILEEIEVKEDIIDKIKAVLIPFFLSIFAFPISILFPNKGLKYSIKAVLYGIDNQLAVLETNYAKKLFLNLKILRAELGEYYSVRLAKEALYAKKNFERMKSEWSYVDKVAFCFQAPIYITYNNILSFIGFFKSILSR